MNNKENNNHRDIRTRDACNIYSRGVYIIYIGSIVILFAAILYNRSNSKQGYVPLEIKKFGLVDPDKVLDSAEVLLEGDEWYFFTAGAVSSEPEGKGKQVPLGIPRIFQKPGPSQHQTLDSSTYKQFLKKKVKFTFPSAEDFKNTNSVFIFDDYLMITVVKEEVPDLKTETIP